MYSKKAWSQGYRKDYYTLRSTRRIVRFKKKETGLKATRSKSKATCKHKSIHMKMRVTAAAGAWQGKFIYIQ